MKISRAILSVSDKTGIADFARGLNELGVELLSTGGTARALREAGLPVIDIKDYTGSPEMLDGRVKTLHPTVHAGILYRRDLPEHQATMDEHGLGAIDLVAVNLYPFEQTIAKADSTFADAIENIDIGGPTMIRAAAKNVAHVTTVIDPADYDDVLAELRNNDGATTEVLRLRLSQKAFARVAMYNSAIANYLAANVDGTRPLVLAYPTSQKLAKGENGHQRGWLYKDAVCEEPSVAHAQVLHGKPVVQQLRRRQRRARSGQGVPRHPGGVDHQAHQPLRLRHRRDRRAGFRGGMGGRPGVRVRQRDRGQLRSRSAGGRVLAGQVRRGGDRALVLR